jgi:hypothetical protein
MTIFMGRNKLGADEGLLDGGIEVVDNWETGGQRFSYAYPL